MAGFFEEENGDRSMTRLTIFALVLCIAAVVATTCVYVLHSAKPDAAIVGGLAGVLGALVLKGIVAIIRKDAGATS